MTYLGTCIDIDDYALNYGFDATEFAQAEHRAIQAESYIEEDYFWEVVQSHIGVRLAHEIKELLSDDVWYGQDPYLNVSWAYDTDSDIHYIFKGLVY